MKKAIITIVSLTICCLIIAQTDYLLEEFANGNCKYVEPNGGVLDLGDNEIIFNYWNIPKVVKSGQVVKSTISYSWNDGCPGCIVFKTVFAEWQPNSPLAELEDYDSQGSANTAIKDFSFTAPSTPGTYRIRLIMTWAYAGINCFYGDGYGGNQSNPGIGPFSEVIITVEDSTETSSQTDYILEEFANGNCKYVEPNGGILDLDNDENNIITMNYWNIPKVVHSGQNVNSIISYSWNDGCPSCIVFKTVYGEWKPNSPLAEIENYDSQGAANTAIKDFSFTAPSTPGTYRIRLIMNWAYAGVNCFYGDGTKGDQHNPGVGNFSEILFEVKNSSSTNTTTVKNTQENILIYPNPTNSIITVELKKSNLDISNIVINDVDGYEQINIINEKLSNNSTYDIDISELQSGIYILNIYWKNNRNTVSKKFTVSK